MTEPRLPTDQQGLVQSQTKTIPDRIWYRWFNWVDQRLRNSVISRFASMDGTDGAFSDLGAGWLTLLFTADRVTPLGIVTNYTNNTFLFEFLGVYNFTYSGSFTHNELNAGRTTNLRVWNVDDAVQIGTDATIATARNIGATDFSFSLIFEVTDQIVDKEIRLEIGGGDTYTTVSFVNSNLDLWSIGRA